MSTEIVTEICVPPEWNLTVEDIHEMVDALEGTYQMYRPAFERRDQAAHGWVYLKGLLSDIPRKVTERIALRFGVNVRSLQHFMGQSPWSCEPMKEIHQELVVQTLGELAGGCLPGVRQSPGAQFSGCSFVPAPKMVRQKACRVAESLWRSGRAELSDQA